MTNLATLDSNSIIDMGHLEITRALTGLPTEVQSQIFARLSEDQAIAVFEQLDPDEQRDLLALMPAERGQFYIEHLPPDVRVRLLDELEPAHANRLIANLSPEEQGATGVLLRHRRETAGRIMTTEFVALPREISVDQALSLIRSVATESETIYTLFVTDPHGRLDGVVSLRDLFVADPRAQVGDVMTSPAISVTTETDQEEVARLLHDLDLLAIPVVNQGNHLVGIITIDDALQVYEDEATEDEVPAKAAWVASAESLALKANARR